MPRRKTPFLAVLMLGSLGFLAVARGQTDAEMEAGRKLFTEAFADEKAGHCPEALEKYRRVQAIKDTSNVRFRIGACSEATGQLRSALVAYDGAIRLSRGDPQAKDVAAEASKRIEALAPKMGKLRIKRPEGASVQLDNEPVAESDLAEPLWVDPGMHVVTATAPNRKPFHGDVPVKEQAEASVEVVLEPNDTVQPPPPPPPIQPSPIPKIVGWSLIGLGGVLAVGGFVSLGVRQASVSSIRDACMPVCPTARQMELQSTRDRALTAGPVAAALFIGGAVSVAAGVVLLLAAPKRVTGLTPVIGPGIAGLAYDGTF
jgi:hypothetical protein